MEKILVHEVGPRDGLQAKKTIAPLDVRIRWLESQLGEKTTNHWVKVLNARGVPAGDLLSLEAALNSEQAKHRSVIAEVEQPGMGKIKIFNMTAKFSKTPGAIENPPPMLSQHAEGVLDELGYTAEQQSQLKAKKII
jgi:crotonobetainyl-CoA:carnitine CoA-transferase CaiB-like acyl-CoA transferase